MAPRLRTFLLVVVLGFAASIALPSLSGAAPAQDSTGAALGGQLTGSTTTVVGATTTPVAATAAPTTTAADTVVDTPRPPAQRLVTESRKVAAVIGALLVVALALTLLTVRYWRATKPQPVEVDEAAEPAVLSVNDTLDDDAIFTATPAEAAPAPASDEVVVGATAPPAEVLAADRSVPGTDHEAADDDWKPLGTGENERIEVPAVGAPARPSSAARRKALGISDQP
ncbi:hypothetical protein [Aquihabitans sp. McL0605]|uniref:hypothetical protein n=1 Tax=Aquihabitans sp. McL0605 TaxID=3415671 RepID=UPI003CF4CCA2